MSGYQTERERAGDKKSGPAAAVWGARAMLPAAFLN